MTREQVEAMAEAVHQAYLDTCARLGWSVKPENQVPYDALSDASKELDRASVRAVLAFVVAAPAQGGEREPCAECDKLKSDLRAMMRMWMEEEQAAQEIHAPEEISGDRFVSFVLWSKSASEAGRESPGCAFIAGWNAALLATPSTEREPS